MGRPDFLTISHSPYKPLYTHTHTCSLTWSFIESVSGATWLFSVICITKLISPYWSHLVVNEPWDFEHTSYPIPIPQFSCFLFPDFKARFKDAEKIYSSDSKKKSLLLCPTFPQQHCVFPGENGGCHFEIIQKFPPFCPIFWPKKEPWIPFKKKSTVFLCQLLSVPICENDLILNHHPSSFLQ